MVAKYESLSLSGGRREAIGERARNKGRNPRHTCRRMAHCGVSKPERYEGIHAVGSGQQ